ncbi:MAG: hypothetical protein DRI44_04625 [Chlamydiae bacterium]|nr:MAG: hypothetical protein DRI44_04625 [Chlamydiota bacterium]
MAKQKKSVYYYDGCAPREMEPEIERLTNEMREAQKNKWIQRAIKKPGALRRSLGVKKGQKIPAKKLKIKKSDSTLMKRRKNLAKTLKKLRKRK